MALSALDLFSVGVGPSSSHTVGPMRAARLFAQQVVDAGRLYEVARVKTELYGSLGATGVGHGSDKAVILGLQGEDPESLDVETAEERVQRCTEDRELLLAGRKTISFARPQDVKLHRRKSLPAHPNGMIFTAYDCGGEVLAESTYYSVGGGFVVEGEPHADDPLVEDSPDVAHPFSSAEELLEHCRRQGKSIAQIMLANELTWRTEEELRRELLYIWQVMRECVENGCSRRETILPGGLKVRRRAPALRDELLAAEQREQEGDPDPLRAVEWVNLFALAVNEENASGGRIVTAPTNGAAGIVPAVLHYYDRFVPGADEDGVVEFLLTAAAVGILFKINASISGAEMGCQGEVGSACSMASAGLAAVLGGTPEQVENAAEIGIEHNLGLTCDPVGGLVQIPCIERNAVASMKAVNAGRMSMRGDGTHVVSLDQAIKTMRDTGNDMKTKYKETSRGGLAVNVVEC